MLGTDLTTTVTTGEGLAHVFVVVDHCTCECVGLPAAKGGNRFEALEPLRQGVREHLGGFEKGIARGLSIRHDHGSAYMSDDLLGVLLEPQGHSPGPGRDRSNRGRDPGDPSGLPIDAHGPTGEVHNAGRIRWVSGRPGEAPAYAGTDFIVISDGRIAAVYIIFDALVA